MKKIFKVLPVDLFVAMRAARTSWMLFVLMAILVTGCTKDNIVPPEEEPGETEEVVKTAREVLSEIKGVTIIDDDKDVDGNDIIKFFFEQPVDHNNPAAGKFSQYCVLHYKGPKNVTLLHTQGYSITTSEKQKVRQMDLAKLLDANYLEVEHRYYYYSTIGLDDVDTDKIPSDMVKGDYWKYNTAEQSTSDLHDIVTAMKNSGCFNGKWVSSGVSKNGILTALYAYFYPNDVDVYVPFCAPFCDGLETSGIGQWLTQESGGKGTALQTDVWNVLRRMSTDQTLREELTKLYKEEHGDNATIQKYSVPTAMCVLIYNYMKNMFHKFCYRPTDEWDGVIPREGCNAELYYGFITLGANDYRTRLNNLRILWDEKEIKENDEYEDETYDDYENEEDWDFDEDTELQSKRRAGSWTLTFSGFLNTIYFAHAAKELGYFLYDWSILPENSMAENLLKWMKNEQTVTRYNKWYGVEYDGGKMMKGFLDFVKNNRNKEKCKMLFVYGGNDPWTGAAIPDPDKDDPCVKKYVVPNGTHNAWLTYPSYYTAQDRDYIVNTVKEWLK